MNLLFIRFLQKLINESTSEGKNKLASGYRKALESIKKYPLPLRDGRDAQNLAGVGNVIAAKLERLLKRYNPPRECLPKKSELFIFQSLFVSLIITEIHLFSLLFFQPTKKRKVKFS